MRLKGKTAIVTGSTRGIGHAIAVAYAAEGANVVVSGTNEELCSAVAGTICNSGGIAIGIPCNILKLESIDRLIQKTINRFGNLDIIVNNAGVVEFRPFLDMDYETLSKVWNVNQYGTYFAAQLAARQMVKQGKGGKIINMSSIVAETAQVELSAYAPTKAAILMMTKCMALELAPYKINVNAIGPGTILTDFNKCQLNKPGHMEAEKAKIPLGIGIPEDIAGAAVYLAGDESRYITGSIIYIDGGYNIQ
jgi:Dehydrogenases with different specificities (related to short-chain alcohol dehydrogenases)